MRNISSIICYTCYSKTKTFSISNTGNVYSICKHKCGLVKQIINLTNIKAISCGNNHFVCINYDGDCYSFGSNNYGQLGIDKYEVTIKSKNPHKINLPPIIQISCGGSFTICLSEKRILYSFGSNTQGQLGINQQISLRSSPQQISTLKNIDFVECSGFSVICKTFKNRFYSWGNNANGDLGRGQIDNCYKPVECKDWPDNIIDIKVGHYHALLLTDEGNVYGFGSNYEGQLGINDINNKKIYFPTLIKDIPEIKRIECGYSQSLCIDINDNLWLFGLNENGQLGLGDTTSKIKPVLHPTLSNVMDISSRGYSTFVKTSDNKIYAFGKNNHSQLGIVTSKDDQLTPIQVLVDNEDIWCSFIGKSRAKSARK